MKQLYMKFLVLLFLFCAVGINADAYNCKVDGIYYNLDNANKTASVTYLSIDNIINRTAYNGAYTIPSTVIYYGIEYSVKSIGEYAFNGCDNLTSVTIPNSVTGIGNYAFYGCSGLTSVEIPNSVTYINFRAFEGCGGLTSIEIPNSVTYIGDFAFNRCNALSSLTLTSSECVIKTFAFTGTAWYSNQPDGLVYIGNFLYAYKGEMPFNSEIVIKDGTVAITEGALCTSINGYTHNPTCNRMISVTIPNSVTYIGDYAFNGCTGLTSVTIGDNVTYMYYNYNDNENVKYYVNRGTIGLLTLWRKNFVPYDISTNVRLDKPSLSLKDKTQTTATISIINYYNEYTYTLRNQTVNDVECFFSDLMPESNCTLFLRVFLDNVPDYYYEKMWEFKTDNISPSVNKISSTASSLTIQGRYNSGDAQITEKWLEIGDRSAEGQTATLTGLDPGKYDAYFSIRVTNGSQTRVYTSSKTTISTETLSLVTQQPKVISAGNVIVAAKSNLDDAEENVGFEWRRTDWTDDFASNSGTAYLYEGTMEGYIRNLYTEKLWKYRPFYTSASGRTYYGEWVGIDPTNTSYFEPTVHTYSTIEVQGNTAAVRGYAMRGTDNITRQGFMYWPQGASHVGRRDAPSVPSNAMTIEATGTVMEAKLTGLAYNTTYSYVAFATTSEGETFYGDERQFTTDIDMSGIEEVEMSSDAATPETWYDLHGRRLSEPRHGINILRMSDGSSRKIFVP